MTRLAPLAPLVLFVLALPNALASVAPPGAAPALSTGYASGAGQQVLSWTSVLQQPQNADTWQGPRSAGTYSTSYGTYSCCWWGWNITDGYDWFGATAPVPVGQRVRVTFEWENPQVGSVRIADDTTGEICTIASDGAGGVHFANTTPQTVAACSIHRVLTMAPLYQDGTQNVLAIQVDLTPQHENLRLGLDVTSGGAYGNNIGLIDGACPRDAVACYHRDPIDPDPFYAPGVTPGWIQLADDATGYSIFRSSTSAPASTPMNASSAYSYVTHEDGLTLAPASEGYYRVVATNELGEGPASEEQYVPPPPPENDEWWNATIIPSWDEGAYVEVVETIDQATTNLGDGEPSTLPDCGYGSPSANARTVWFNITPNRSGTLVMDTLNTTTAHDTVLSIHAEPRYTTLACNDDADTTNVRSWLSYDVTANTSYHVEIADWSTDASPITLHLSGTVWNPNATAGGGHEGNPLEGPGLDKASLAADTFRNLAFGIPFLLLLLIIAWLLREAQA